MMTSRADVLTARAIATICRVAVLHDCSGRFTSTAMPNESRMAAASRRTRAQSMKPRRVGSRPTKMFSASERCGIRFSS